jgi:multisubunit Na+/H+ antiporter MnhB subunit
MARIETLYYVLTSPIVISMFSTIYVFCTVLLVALRIGGFQGWLVEAILLFPFFFVWYRVESKRQKKTVEAMLRGFTISPERTEQALSDYEAMIKKKKETK